MSAIDDYLANVPDEQKVALERVRTIARQAIPEPEETISYGMPTLKYKGKYVLAFAPFKDHMSIFPGAWPDTFKNKLQNFKTSRGTIQFTLEKQIPENIITDLVSVRVKDIEK